MMKETAERNKWPVEISEGLIGSCTNSSYEDILRASSVVKNALREKLTAKAELKIIPGSELIRKISENEGLLNLFRESEEKFMPAPADHALDNGKEKAVKIILLIPFFTPLTVIFQKYRRKSNTHAFIASPEIVAALTIAGKLTFNPLTDSLINSDGRPVNLAEPRGNQLPPDGFKINTPENRNPPLKKPYQRLLLIHDLKDCSY
jgi:aconitate hydratase